jgi:hypothetical protein
VLSRIPSGEGIDILRPARALPPGRRSDGPAEWHAAAVRQAQRWLRAMRCLRVVIVRRRTARFNPENHFSTSWDIVPPDDDDNMSLSEFPRRNSQTLPRLPQQEPPLLPGWSYLSSSVAHSSVIAVAYSWPGAGSDAGKTREKIPGSTTDQE